jgi:replication fork protection complex subunit Tof1/Swi1
MERSKVRDTDNTRTFYLSRFFIEYLLILRHKQESRKDKQKAVEGFLEDELALGLVAEMAEMETVRWVFMRMKITMDDKVCLMQAHYVLVLTTCSLPLGQNCRPAWIALPKS